MPGLPALRKTTRPEAIAAAVCWVIGKSNQRFGRTDGELRVKDLTSYFSLGQSGISERGFRVMRAAGIRPPCLPKFTWAPPDLLGLAPPETPDHRSRAVTAPRAALKAGRERPGFSDEARDCLTRYYT